MLRIFSVLIVFFTSLASFNITASIITINHSDRGLFGSLGDHIASQQNTTTGPRYKGGANSFFVFDLSNINTNIFSAKLRWRIDAWSGTDQNGIISFWDFGGNINSLNRNYAENDPLGIDIHRDFQSGSLFAEKSVLRSDVGEFMEIPLNNFAVQDIQQNLGAKIAIGVHFETPASASWIRFSANRGRVKQELILNDPQADNSIEVHAPKVMYLFGFACLFLILGAIRRDSAC